MHIVIFILLHLLYYNMPKHEYNTSFTNNSLALSNPAHIQEITCGDEYICTSFDSDYCPNCGEKLKIEI
jgi:hypothetical protein